jgi:signal transduction histidine kinase
MRKMIYDLLDLTRIESGQKRRELAPVDIAELAAEAVETFTPQAAEQEVTIELAAEPVEMTADRSEIEIILNNLISNAVKYNRTGGSVKVEVGPAAGGGTSITVADTGIGMSEEERAKLFTEFTRIKNAKTRNILGSGLGLSILKKLIDYYDGQVDVQSQPDVGTTFAVVLRDVPNEQ